MGCFVVAEFLLTSASRGLSAIAELLVFFYNFDNCDFSPASGHVQEYSSRRKFLHGRRPITLVLFSFICVLDIGVSMRGSVNKSSYLSSYVISSHLS